MKKLMTAVLAAVITVGVQIPCLAATDVCTSPDTGDISVYVIIALVVAAAAIVGTLLYTKFKK